VKPQVRAILTWGFCYAGPVLLTDLLTSHHRRGTGIVLVALVLDLDFSRDRSGECGCYAVRALPDDMGVDAQRDSRVGVAESFRDDVHRDSWTPTEGRCSDTTPGKPSAYRRATRSQKLSESSRPM
jgi:hypothetical protein